MGFSFGGRRMVLGVLVILYLAQFDRCVIWQVVQAISMHTITNVILCG